MSRGWMPMFWADYLADTSHLLGCAEHGAYLLLIAHYWQKGSLPKQDERLASIAKAGLEQWLSMKPTIASFFDDDWRHARIELELEKARISHEKRALAGKKGGSSRVANVKQCLSNAQAMLNQSQSQSHIDTNVSIERASQAKPARSKKRTSITENYQPTDADKLEAEKACLSQAEFRSEWGKFRDYHISKGTLNANWQAAWRNWLSKVSEFSPKQRAGPAKQKISAITEAILFMENDHGQSKNNTLSDNPLIQQIPRLIGNG